MIFGNPILDAASPHALGLGARLFPRLFSAARLALVPALGDQLLAPVPTERLLPEGRGVFVGSWGRFTSEAKVEALVREAGLDYVILLGPWHKPRGKSRFWNTSDRAAKKVEAARRAGAKIHVFGWPDPSRPEQFVHDLSEFATAHHAVSACLDPEAPFYGEPEAMQRLIAEACEVFHARGMAVGTSSYGAPWWHRTFPWKEMAGEGQDDRPDYAIPQVYDGKNSLGPGYPAKGVAAYQALGPWTVIPGFGVYNKSAGQFAKHLDTLPPGTCCGWSGRQLTRRKRRVLREYDERFEHAALVA